MDPRTGPVTLTISGTSAALLGAARADPTLGGDAGAVLMRALGLFDLALKAKREGKKLGFYDPERDTLERGRVLMRASWQGPDPLPSLGQLG